MPLVTVPPMFEIRQILTKSDCPRAFDRRPESSRGPPYVTKALTLNKDADDQRGKSKHTQSATKYHHQPNGPDTVALDNLKGYIREVSPRHRTSPKTIEIVSVSERRSVAPHTAEYRTPQIDNPSVIRAAQKVKHEREIQRQCLRRIPARATNRGQCRETGRIVVAAP
jgi:hypothetical protein